MCGRSLNSCRSRGLTLIEVITALAILSTLLVGMLVAFKKNSEQIHTQLAVREATSSVDQLLFVWARQGIYPPARSSGDLPDTDNMTWETWPVTGEHRDTLGLDIIRLSVYANDNRDRSVPVLSLELPIPARGGAAAAGNSNTDSNADPSVTTVTRK